MLNSKTNLRYNAHRNIYLNNQGLYVFCFNDLQVLQELDLKSPLTPLFQRGEKGKEEELIANCDRFKTIKYSPFNPYAFTEQGVAMLPSVPNSERAIMLKRYMF